MLPIYMFLQRLLWIDSQLIHMWKLLRWEVWSKYARLAIEDPMLLMHMLLLKLLSTVLVGYGALEEYFHFAGCKED